MDPSTPCFVYFEDVVDKDGRPAEGIIEECEIDDTFVCTRVDIDTEGSIRLSPAVNLYKRLRTELETRCITILRTRNADGGNTMNKEGEKDEEDEQTKVPWGAAVLPIEGRKASAYYHITAFPPEERAYVQRGQFAYMKIRRQDPNDPRLATNTVSKTFRFIALTAKLLTDMEVAALSAYEVFQQRYPNRSHVAYCQDFVSARMCILRNEWEIEREKTSKQKVDIKNGTWFDAKNMTTSLTLFWPPIPEDQTDQAWFWPTKGRLQLPSRSRPKRSSRCDGQTCLRTSGPPFRPGPNNTLTGCGSNN